MSLLASVKSKVQAARKALQTASGSVADVRAAIDGLKEERARIASAALPRDEAAPLLRETVDRLIAGIAPQFAALGDVIDAIAHNRPFDLRVLKPAHRAELLMTALAPLLHARFQEELAAFYSASEAGLSRAEREQRLAQIDAELLELQKTEESLIEELAGAGVAIDRRGDIDARVLLGIAE